MKIGVLGTGMVGKAIGTKLVQLGHSVKMGSRTSTNEKAAEWVKANGSNASQGTFAEVASFGEILFNCTSGMAALEALKLAGASNMSGKGCRRAFQSATPTLLANKSSVRFRK